MKTIPSRMFALTLIISVLCFTTTQAQHNTVPFPDNALFISAGVGLGSNLNFSGGETTLPPVSASLDLAFLHHITVGPYLALTNNNDANGLGYEHGIIAIKGAYHIALPVPQWNVYAGGLLGYHGYDSPTVAALGAYRYLDYHEANLNHTAYSIFAGAQYLLSKRVQAFAEAGYGITYLNMGLSFKVK